MKNLILVGMFISQFTLAGSEGTGTRGGGNTKIDLYHQLPKTLIITEKHRLSDANTFAIGKKNYAGMISGYRYAFEAELTLSLDKDAYFSDSEYKTYELIGSQGKHQMKVDVLNSINCFTDRDCRIVVKDATQKPIQFSYKRLSEKPLISSILWDDEKLTVKETLDRFTKIADGYSDSVDFNQVTELDVFPLLMNYVMNTELLMATYYLKLPYQKPMSYSYHDIYFENGLISQLKEEAKELETLLLGSVEGEGNARTCNHTQFDQAYRKIMNWYLGSPMYWRDIQSQTKLLKERNLTELKKTTKEVRSPIFELLMESIAPICKPEAASTLRIYLEK